MPNSRLSNAELRCCCGSLMARVTARGIELKCRRCKRIVLVPADSAQQGWVAVHAEGAMRR
jgi:phage FluMu protein Com